MHLGLSDHEQLVQRFIPGINMCPHMWPFVIVSHFPPVHANLPFAKTKFVVSLTVYNWQSDSRSQHTGTNGYVFYTKKYCKTFVKHSPNSTTQKIVQFLRESGDFLGR